MAASPTLTRARILPFGEAAVAEAARLVREGLPVALPTETVYGLAADAGNRAAVTAIYTAKGRPAFNPLIVHVQDQAMAARFALMSTPADALAAAFWPGPLTLVLPRRSGAQVCDLAVAGLDTIAVRVPAHRAMRAVLAATNLPLAAPSANPSGGISPTQAMHVLAGLGERIDLIVDDGPATDGLGSTIVAVEAKRLRLLRPGPIDADRLVAVSGLPIHGGPGPTTIEAPGQLASHYSPAKPLRLNATRAEPGEHLIGFGTMACNANLSVHGNLAEAATNLFAMLHAADAGQAERIAIAPIPSIGIGVAINDRLARAAA